ncbi:MAG: CoA protein activase [Atribacterota bacterium]|jgi:predicted nucleotide-binding protein (sugar kinase/HSP70/actin superfamily)|nr:CoA protein activase [Atribacterota bacterium]
MKLALPRLGNIDVINETIITDMGHELAEVPPNSKKTLDLGVRYSPEYCCLPLKIALGNFIEALELGAEGLIMAGGWGPCRFGYYAQVQRDVLIDLGYDFKMIIMEIPRGNWMTLWDNINILRNGRSWSYMINQYRLAWQKILLMEKLENKVLQVRPREKKRGESSRALKESMIKIKKAKDLETLKQIEEDSLSKFKEITDFQKKILIRIALVGEFYVSLEPFSNHHLEEKLGYLGVEVVRKNSIEAWIGPIIRLKIFKDSFKEEKEIEEAAYHYLAHSVGGEGQTTVGNVVLAHREGLDGAIQVIPFTCMPEIVAETILKKVSEDLNFPTLTLTYDEQTGEEGLNTRIEAFIDLLKKRRKKVVMVS